MTVTEELIVEFEYFIRIGWRQTELLLSQPYPLSRAEISALLVIGRDDKITAGMLAQNLGVGRPAASHLIRRLTDLGYVIQAAPVDDRRKRILTLSHIGSTLLHAIHSARRTLWSPWLTCLSWEEQEVLLGMMKKLTASSPMQLHDEHVSG